MDPDEDHFDPPRCSYSVKVTIVKEITVEDYPDKCVGDLTEKIIDEIRDNLEEDDISAAEITNAFVWD